MEQKEKNGENKYWENPDFLMDVVNLIPFGVFWKDTESVFLGCNTAFSEWADLKSPRQVVGKTDYDLPWQNEESDLYRQDDKWVMQNQQAKLNIEETITLSNGLTKRVITSKIPFFSKSGQVVGILGIFRELDSGIKLVYSINLLLNLLKISASKLNILVIDNNKPAVMSAINLFQQLQCYADIAMSKHSALAKIRVEKYDLILLDMNLPDQSSYETAKKIRLLDGTVPIIGLTTKRIPHIEEAYFSIGMNALVTKPLSKQQLIDLLNTFVPPMIKDDSQNIEDIEKNINKHSSNDASICKCEVI